MEAVWWHCGSTGEAPGRCASVVSVGCLCTSLIAGLLRNLCRPCCPAWAAHAATAADAANAAWTEGRAQGGSARASESAAITSPFQGAELTTTSATAMHAALDHLGTLGTLGTFGGTLGTFGGTLAALGMAADGKGARQNAPLIDFSRLRILPKRYFAGALFFFAIIKKYT